MVAAIQYDADTLMLNSGNMMRIMCLLVPFLYCTARI